MDQQENQKAQKQARLAFHENEMSCKSVHTWPILYSKCFVRTAHFARHFVDALCANSVEFNYRVVLTCALPRSCSTPVEILADGYRNKLHKQNSNERFQQF